MIYSPPEKPFLHYSFAGEMYDDEIEVDELLKELK
jgi:hypothetical protein